MSTRLLNQTSGNERNNQESNLGKCTNGEWGDVFLYGETVIL